MNRRTLESLGRRAIAGDLAAAKTMVRLLEAQQEPDRKPGHEWQVVIPVDRVDKTPTTVKIAAPKSKEAAIRIAREYGADESGAFNMIRFVRVPPPDDDIEGSERVVWILDTEELLSDVGLDAYYEYPGHVGIQTEEGRILLGGVSFTFDYDGEDCFRGAMNSADGAQSILAFDFADDRGHPVGSPHDCARWIAEVVKKTLAAYPRDKILAEIEWARERGLLEDETTYAIDKADYVEARRRTRTGRNMNLDDMFEIMHVAQGELRDQSMTQGDS